MTYQQRKYIEELVNKRCLGVCYRGESDYLTTDKQGNICTFSNSVIYPMVWIDVLKKVGCVSIDSSNTMAIYLEDPSLDYMVIEPVNLFDIPLPNT